MSGGESMARGSREEEEAEMVLRRAWSSSSWEGEKEAGREK